MIRTQNLVKRFGDLVAVAGLDLDIARGELFCLLGPNGAGKTTTIKLLTSLLRPSSGRAQVGGYDIQQQARQAKRLLGYIPDHPYLYDKLTGMETMRFVAGLYQLDDATFEARVHDLLERYELAHVTDRLVERYSHGMRQKLSFASCFLHAPEVVVVDEPWVGLDPKNKRMIKHDLRARTREGMTILMSTHSLAIAEELADRVGILHDGRLLHVGTVEEIKALASNPGSLEDVFLELTRDVEHAG